MLDHGIGCLPVVDDSGRLCGMVTESDFATREYGFPFSTFRYPKLFGQWVPQEGIERIYEAARTMKAREIMTPEVVRVCEDDSLNVILQQMLSRGLHRLPVVRDGVVVGMITRRDLLRVMLRESPPVPDGDRPSEDC
jgi:CBS domain-containing protein